MNGDKQSDFQLSLQLQRLREIHGQIQSLRQLTPALLRLPTPNVLSDDTLSISSKVEMIKAFGDLISLQDSQAALKHAQESAGNDKTDIPNTGRRENIKRRRASTPDSPQPYIQMKPKSSSVFPTLANEPSPIRIDDLINYLRDFNRTHDEKLQIWCRSRASKALTSPITLRYTITDVLTSYITVNYESDDPILSVESFSAFGSRENNLPHSQSSYAVYQKLSQQVMRMIQSHGRVTLQSFVHLMLAYGGLFVDQCSVCERVASAEGHIPPVARVWIEDSRGEIGKWDVRHVVCLRD